ncbi:MAG: class I SAM-dependent methyltransferase [Chloroflexota bacterium]
MQEKADQYNQETRTAWNANADAWDKRMGDEGNDFVNELIWPSAQKLLDLKAGERVLDIGCGNGLYSRRLATLGGNVDAFDFADALVERAQRYPMTFESGGSITYHVLDATDEEALLALGSQRFDAAFCTMALMDIADIEPLMKALAKLLKPGGRFIFATAHPCFNQAFAAPFAEMENRGEMMTTYGVKVTKYMTPIVEWGLALANQPEPQRYFERPLHLLLQPAFAAGLVMDALDERAFSPENQPSRFPLGWSGKFSEIPPVLVGRMRLL